MDSNEIQACEPMFRLLGAVDVQSVELPLGPPKQRCLLAALLLEPGRTRTVEQLIDAIWGEDPPASARKAIQVYVSNLRRALAPLRDVALETASGGYRLVSPTVAIDLLRFRELVDRAGTEWGTTRRTLLHRAVRLWRGTPLSGTGDSDFILRNQARLQQERLEALEARIAADLDAGEMAGLTRELDGLLIEFPLREPLYELLMLVHWAEQRPNEALAVFATAGRVLSRELGTDPGTALRRLHRRLLAADRRSAETTHTAPRLAQLPAGTPQFTGRRAEQRRIATLLADADAGTSPVIVVDGMAGVGKTGLVLRCAHQAADRYPDGQLYLDMRGHGGGNPVSAQEALERLLRSLDVPAEQIPEDESAAAALYRSTLFGHRLLIVADNVGHAEQIYPLIPGDLDSRLIVTSRHRLNGFIARTGADSVSLDVLSTGESVELIGRVAGPDVVLREPEAAKTLAALCSYLPLALRIALARMSAEDGLGGLVRRLGAGRPLADLHFDDDPHASVRTAFHHSYVLLPIAQQRLFRHIGLSGLGEIDAHGAAALLEIELAEADDHLRRLAEAHLVEPGENRGFRLHDVVREYAMELGSERDSAEARAAALGRLLAYYQQTVEAAVHHIIPPHDRPARTPATQHHFADRATALAWLDSQQVNVVILVEQAAEQGRVRAAWQLADALWRYLLFRRHITYWLSTHRVALRSAELAGDRIGEAITLTHLAIGTFSAGRFHEAQRLADRALILHQRSGDWAHEWQTMNSLANCAFRLGNSAEALEWHRHAAALCRRHDAVAMLAGTMTNQALLHEQLGEFAQALSCSEQALTAYRQIGDRPGEARVLSNLGKILTRSGDPGRALEVLRDCLAIKEELGDRDSLAAPLANLGSALARLGRLAEAAEYHREALEIVRRTEPTVAAEILNSLGLVLTAMGEAAEAIRHHRAALSSARQCRDRYQEAKALDALATAHRSLGEHATARERLRDALSVYEALGVPEAEATRSRLAEDAAADADRACPHG
ncbi:AfsR/SARP family transcriptional regulator [Actinoalloteichus hymeniacidonis]|uniref:DNA-binding transcriptional activator of the SARP family n=1 Tax=Actinoalloteichus hymeniacidonis TaxID=340345 RepID=A0AAC9HPN4_9PSEU|nr:tetratricopeptide repeat protein [Actinoalloteichus hymeniacidonis]AOS63282.1 DNA-binding transcriptional activator of the SARP family [Actinoalloteichus hymeniacidonis]MBB5908679.1 DNA-binding SARP family transcriptional activator/Tfp pilus assembly protein PilF [Actinoalloteichus hymeniacidonis]